MLISAHPEPSRGTLRPQPDRSGLEEGLHSARSELVEVQNYSSLGKSSRFSSGLEEVDEWIRQLRDPETKSEDLFEVAGHLARSMLFQGTEKGMDALKEVLSDRRYLLENRIAAALGLGLFGASVNLDLLLEVLGQSDEEPRLRRVVAAVLPYLYYTDAHQVNHVLEVLRKVAVEAESSDNLALSELGELVPDLIAAMQTHFVRLFLEVLYNDRSVDPNQWHGRVEPILGDDWLFSLGLAPNEKKNLVMELLTNVMLPSDPFTIPLFLSDLQATLPRGNFSEEYAERSASAVKALAEIISHASDLLKSSPVFLTMYYQAIRFSQEYLYPPSRFKSKQLRDAIVTHWEPIWKNYPPSAGSSFTPATGLEETPTVAVLRASTPSYAGVGQKGEDRPFGPPEAFFPVALKSTGDGMVFGIWHPQEDQIGWAGISWVETHLNSDTATRIFSSLERGGNPAPGQILDVQAIPTLKGMDLIVLHGARASAVLSYYSLTPKGATGVVPERKMMRLWSDLFPMSASTPRLPYKLAYDQRRNALLFFSSVGDREIVMHSMEPTAFLNDAKPLLQRDARWTYQNRPVAITSDPRDSVWVLTAGGNIESLAYDKQSASYEQEREFSAAWFKELGLQQPDWPIGSFLAFSPEGHLLLTTAESPSLWVLDPWGKNMGSNKGVHFRADLRGLLSMPKNAAQKRPIPVWVEPTSGRTLLGNPYPEGAGGHGRIYILPSISELERKAAGKPLPRVNDAPAQRELSVRYDPLLNALPLWGLRWIEGRLFLFDRSSNPDSGGSWQGASLSPSALESLKSDGVLSMPFLGSDPQALKLPKLSDFSATEISLELGQGKLRAEITLDGTRVYLKIRSVSESGVLLYSTSIRLNWDVLGWVGQEDRFWLEGISADSSGLTLGLLHSDGTLKEETYLELKIPPKTTDARSPVQVQTRRKLDGQGFIGLVRLEDGSLVTYDALHSRLQLLDRISERPAEAAGLEEAPKQAQGLSAELREFVNRLSAVSTGDVFYPGESSTALFLEAMEYLRPLFRYQEVLDVGTGSGALIVNAVRRLEAAGGVGIDLDQSAAETAQANAQQMKVSEKITFLEGDLFEPVTAAGRKFDVVLFNAPDRALAEVFVRNVREVLKPYGIALLMWNRQGSQDLAAYAHQEELEIAPLLERGDGWRVYAITQDAERMHLVRYFFDRNYSDTGLEESPATAEQVRDWLVEQIHHAFTFAYDKHQMKERHSGALENLYHRQEAGQETVIHLGPPAYHLDVRLRVVEGMLVVSLKYHLADLGLRAVYALAYEEGMEELLKQIEKNPQIQSGRWNLFRMDPRTRIHVWAPDSSIGNPLLESFKGVSSQVAALLRWREKEKKVQVIGPSIAAQYPLLGVLADLMPTLVLIDPGGEQTQFVMQRLRDSGVRQAVYNGQTEEYGRFLTHPHEGIRIDGPVGSGTADFSRFLLQMLANMTGRTVENTEILLGDIRKLEADLKLISDL